MRQQGVASLLARIAGQLQFLLPELESCSEKSLRCECVKLLVRKLKSVKMMRMILMVPECRSQCECVKLAMGKLKGVNMMRMMMMRPECRSQCGETIE